jgi:hypothetical protein
MRALHKKLDRIESIFDAIQPDEETEWEHVITIGGKNPGEKLVHKATGEECTDAGKIHDYVTRYEERRRALAKNGRPLPFDTFEVIIENPEEGVANG